MENSLKNPNTSNLDEYQMANRSFDAKKDAVRVSVVDGIDIKVENLSIPELKFPEQSPVVIKELEVIEIKVPEIIKETEIVQVPVLIKELEIKTVEIPVVVPEIKIVEIEKPVIIKEIQVIEQKVYELPKFAKICMIIQTLALLGLMLSNIIK